MPILNTSSLFLAQTQALARTLVRCLPWAAIAFSSSAFAGYEVLGCATREKERVVPSEPLDCHGAEGHFKSSLIQLYADGWRLIDAEYFAQDEPVFYLERPKPAVAEEQKNDEASSAAPE